MWDIGTSRPWLLWVLKLRWAGRPVVWVLLRVPELDQAISGARLAGPDQGDGGFTPGDVSPAFDRGTQESAFRQLQP